MLLDEALDLSLAARSTPFVTMCLAAYARLAFGLDAKCGGGPAYESSGPWRAAPV